MVATDLNETAKALAQELYRQAQREPEPVPEGFYTRHEWQKLFNKSITQTTKALNKLTEIGKLEKRKFKVLRDKRGRVAPQNHWRVAAVK